MRPDYWPQGMRNSMIMSTKVSVGAELMKKAERKLGGGKEKEKLGQM